MEGGTCRIWGKMEAVVWPDTREWRVVRSVMSLQWYKLLIFKMERRLEYGKNEQLGISFEKNLWTLSIFAMWEDETGDQTELPYSSKGRTYVVKNLNIVFLSQNINDFRNTLHRLHALEVMLLIWMSNDNFWSLVIPRSETVGGLGIIEQASW